MSERRTGQFDDVGVDTVWHSKRKGENRYVLITGVLGEKRRPLGPGVIPARVVVRRNTSTRAQSISIKALLKDYEFVGMRPADGSWWAV
jgi:hypothetical protein